ncbi:MAG: DUF3732 domain-containing protein [Bacteroidetes bacterium]|nr:DUF3732 domain-containing protein [Bacteroidota bacterium]
MQIKNLILYNSKENVRLLPFRLGDVNIISGESKSGKTAIIDIIDYCLGSKDCKVAEGIIRDTVYWFAITVVFNKGEEFFIARQNPNTKGVNTISEIYLEAGPFDTFPEFDSIQPNSNLIGLKEFLSRKIGIADNLQIFENNTREPLEINFKHSRLFCYQPQGLIAQRDYLFYNQTEPFVPQSIKDSLPYLLGAIREDSLSIEQQIIQKRRDLNRAVREKNEQEKIKVEGISKAFSLVEELKEIGILAKNVGTKDVAEALSILNQFKDWEYSSETIEPTGENSILKDLINKRRELKQELGGVDDTIYATESFIKHNFSYSEEVEQQKVRLESIHLYQDADGNTSVCPLCDSHLNIEIPKISEIEQSLNNLKKTLESTVREKPRLNSYLEGLYKGKESLKGEIIRTEESISALYNEQEKARRLRDLNLRRGKVIGRISLFLESVDYTQDESIDAKILKLKEDIEGLISLVDTETKEEKLVSILSKINLQMSKWVDQLDVEYKDSPIRFDPNKLTLFADTTRKPISLSQMGSGANWVSYHLLIHFALHQHFVQNSRPVPRFLILDQPSQVYFPPDKDEENTGEIKENADELAVKSLFDFIINRTKEMAGDFQTIVTDHAYLKHENFRQSVIEVWRDGTKLIPNSWLELGQEES